MTTLRAVRLPEDLEALWQIAVACESEVLDEIVTTREEIRSQLEGPEVAAVDGARVAIEADGTLSGFLAVSVDPEGREVFVDAFARPGAGSAVLDALLEHGVTFAHGRVAGEDSGWVVSAGAFPTDTAYVSALSRLGFAPVRRFHRMRAELDPAGPVIVPPLAPGAVISVVGEDEATQRIVHEVVEDAFAEHWRPVRYPWEAWIAYHRNRGYDPTQWWLATVDGQPAGALLANDTVAELGSAYVSMLGVTKAYRGLGLGRALLRTAFTEAARRGRTSVRLGVDTENGTGAPALYASVGMTPAEVVDAYELPLT